MCAKNHLLIFSSFLDIWENVEWPRFFGPPCITALRLLRCDWLRRVRRYEKMNMSVFRRSGRCVVVVGRSRNCDTGFSRPASHCIRSAAYGDARHREMRRILCTV